MSGDYSRVSFNHWRDYHALWMQQGKVQLDADWNELVAILDRRSRAGSLDTLGHAAVPRETLDGFRIEVVAGALRIHPGRIYVDGILAENHGSGGPVWEPHLAELRRPDPIDYLAQPYMRNPPPLPAAGRHVVYLDVWRREITHLEEPDLVEKAIGIDTATRSQTVWQVKLWPAGPDVVCSTPLAELPKWTAMKGPSGARLTTDRQLNPAPPDPCTAPPTAGYTGLENQLYRVEIHDDGSVGAATFKWSRDNASVAARVLGITGNTTLNVDTVGKDGLLRFSDGDWIEITDDHRELAGLPGIVRRIKSGGGVDDATRTIVLAAALPAGTFPVNAQNQTDTSRHTRIRRWDQKGKVFREDGTEFADLDAAGSTGVIPVPPAGTRLILEQGVVVEFSLVASLQFRACDYWTFAARAADASVERLTEAPPLGIHHHYAKLAIVTFPDTEEDCRVLWPPPTGEGGSCECTVCVSPEAHNSGQQTIQQALDSVKEHGGTVCLEPGTYRLRAPLEIVNTQGVRLRGHGVATTVAADAPGPVLRLQDVRACLVEDIGFVGTAREGRATLIEIVDVTGLELRRLMVLGLVNDQIQCLAIGLGGNLLGLRIADCMTFSDDAICRDGALSDRLLAAEVLIDDNAVLARRIGVSLDSALIAAEIRVGGNLIALSPGGGIRIDGAALPGANVRIDGNTVYALGMGIIAGVSDTSVSNNVVRGLPRESEPSATDIGIVVGSQFTQTLERIQVIGNRVIDVGDTGIAVFTAVASVMIKQNVVQRAGATGISIDTGESPGPISIENNQISEVGTDARFAGIVMGIRVTGVRHAAIAGNSVFAIGRGAIVSPLVAGIATLAQGHLQITGNSLLGVGPVEDFLGQVAGILVAGDQFKADIAANVVQRTAAGDPVRIGEGRWIGIMIGIDDAPVQHIGKAHAFAVAGKTAATFLGTRVVLADVTDGLARNVALRGNHVVGQTSRTPLIVAVSTEFTIMSECRIEVPLTARSSVPLVLLRRMACTVSNNVARFVGSDSTLIDIDATSHFVVVGNLATGQIFVNGAALSGTMAQLNVVNGSF